jgi:hypothetical protein
VVAPWLTAVPDLRRNAQMIFLAAIWRTGALYSRGGTVLPHRPPACIVGDAA